MFGNGKTLISHIKRNYMGLISDNIGQEQKIMEQMTLFDDRISMAPLASRLRPAALEEFAGQEHLLGEGKMLV